MARSSRPEVFCKNGVLRDFAKFTGKNLRHFVPCNFIKKETLAQVFSCKLCEISKKTFFIEHFWWLLLNGDINYKKSERDQIKSNNKQATT